ncbi:MAG: APC family permease [Desulfitobacteriaceae bacterium]
MSKTTFEEPGLRRSLTLFGNISISVSDISPTTGIFLMAPAVLLTVGTGAFIAYLGAAVIALSVALSMGELGAMYPSAGGLYSIVYRVMGRPIGFLALLNYLVQGVFLPASIAFGAANYVVNIFPGWNENITAFSIMLACTLITILSIKWNAKLVEVFLFIELAIVGVLAVVGALHPVQSVSSLLTPVALNSQNGLSSVAWPAIFAAVTVALFSFNGYDGSINFSEETGKNVNIGKTLFISASIGILAQIIPLFFILISVPDVKGFLASSAPINYIGVHYMGQGANLFLDAGAAIAMINCVLAVLLQFSRVVYAAGRDRAFPDVINKTVTSIHPKFKTPWIATLIIGGVGALICFNSSLIAVVTFTSVTIVCLYAVIALSVIISRVRDRDVHRTFKTPLFPLIPSIAFLGSMAALTQQAAKDLITTAVVFVVGLVYYYLYLRPRSKTHWILSQSEPNRAGNNNHTLRKEERLNV